MLIVFWFDVEEWGGLFLFGGGGVLWFGKGGGIYLFFGGGGGIYDLVWGKGMEDCIIGNMGVILGKIGIIGNRGVLFMGGSDWVGGMYVVLGGKDFICL